MPTPISDADPGAWAFALGCPPWLHDSGRDDCAFNEAFQLSKFAGHGQPDADRLAPALNLHAGDNTRG